VQLNVQLHHQSKFKKKLFSKKMRWFIRIGMRCIFLYMIILCCFSSCAQEETPVSIVHKRIEIPARDDGSIREKRPLIYRFKVNPEWKLSLPDSKESIVDTTKALAEIFILDGSQKIRIAIHNFPSDQMNERIPPLAQIARWKKQFQTLTPQHVTITPQAFGGYHGYLMEATGVMHDIPTTVIGWSLQLPPEHYQSLHKALTRTEQAKLRQMRGDITIKATGPTDLMHKHREEIVAFARSFQLIDDIP